MLELGAGESLELFKRADKIVHMQQKKHMKWTPRARKLKKLNTDQV